MQPRLAVLTPWSSQFMHTAYVDAQLNLQRPEGWDVRHIRGLGWSPARRHIDMCQKALIWGADILCITGADQVHPEDLLPRLVARMESGYDAVACLVPARGYIGIQAGMKPFQPVAWRIKRTGRVTMDEANALVDAPCEIEIINPADGDMQEINFCGSGVLAFRREHLEALKAPWFFETFNPETYEREASMDTKFSWRLQTEGGARLWVDTTLAIGHIHPFVIDSSYSARFSDWATPGVGDPAICRYPVTQETPA